jgi:hypothetical protein
MLVLAPQKEGKKQIEKQLAEKKQMYENVLKVTQEETKIQLNEQIERLQVDLKDFVIDFEDSANLTFDISQIANEKKVASFSVKTKDKDKEGRGSSATPDYEYISENHIDVRFTAGFNQFAALLNALERHRPVVFVDRFVIARPKQPGSGNEVSMNLAVFVRKRQGS